MEPFPPQREPGHSGAGSERRQAREATHAETFYLLRLVESRQPVRIRLRGGEELSGSVAWYDRGCLRLDLAPGGHRIVQKTAMLTLTEEPTPPAPQDANGA